MKILVIEDHKLINKNICLFLKSKKFDATWILDWKKAIEKLSDENFDLIILDRMLPWKNWVEICKELRKKWSSIPILMLTALDSINEKIEWFDAWADDYLAKPFSFEELFARVKALLRRKEKFISEEIYWWWWKWKINLDNNKIFKKNSKNIFEEIKLSLREFNFIWYLAKNSWKTISKTELLENVWWWWDALFLSETVEVHTSYLRKKLWKEVLQTVRWIWYLVEK